MGTPSPPAESLSILDLIDQTTIVSLLGVVAILGAAYALSLLSLPRATTPTAIRILFIWHSFSCLIHLIFEGSFLYNVFFSSIPASHLPTYSATLPPLPSSIPPQPAGFLSNFVSSAVDNKKGGMGGDIGGYLYGNAYATNWAGKLWMVYAQADARWAGVDLTVVSLEVLTVVLGVPGALWCVYCLGKGRRDRGFWMIVLGTGELYGGFMTFCPEWLTGNQYLDTSNFMFKWVFIIFFNMLWVFFPLYSLWWSYGDLVYGGKDDLVKREKRGKAKGKSS